MLAPTTELDGVAGSLGWHWLLGAGGGAKCSAGPRGQASSTILATISGTPLLRHSEEMGPARGLNVVLAGGRFH